MKLNRPALGDDRTLEHSILQESDAGAHYAGTGSGLMNTESAMVAIVSPLAFGFIVDLTGRPESRGLMPRNRRLPLNLQRHPDENNRTRPRGDR